LVYPNGGEGRGLILCLQQVMGTTSKSRVLMKESEGTNFFKKRGGPKEDVSPFGDKSI